MVHHLTPAQRRWRRARLALQATVAFVVIGSALVLGSIGLALPWLVSHPEKVRSFLSEKLKRPVSFESLAGRWTPRGPVFALERVQLGDPAGGESFAIARAELVIDFYAWLQRNSTFSEFRVIGMQAEVVRDADGALRIERLGGTAGGGRGNTLFELGSVSLVAARIELRDELRGSAMSLERVDVRLINDGGMRRVGGVAWTSADSPPLRFSCEIGAPRSRCYVEGSGVEPARWLARMPVAGIGAVSGHAGVRLWFEFGREILSARLELEADDLVLRGERPVELGDELAIEPRARLSQWRLSARWQRDDDGWHADLLEWRGDEDEDPGSHLRVVARGAPGARGYALIASKLDLAQLAPLLALSHEVPARLRRLAFEASPRGVLSDVRASAARGRLHAIDARIDALELRPGARTPGIGTFAGRVIGDDEALVILPDRTQQLVLDYPHVFRKPIAFELEDATFGVLRRPDGLHVEATGLDLSGEGFAARGRASLWFDPDGKRPTLDATIALEADDIAAAKLFWPINAMPPKTVAWLDRGLVAGRVSRGIAVVRGDLDAWPFRGDDGRFEGRAQLAGVELDYHPRWPHATRLAGEAVFIKGGMSLAIEGADILGNRVASGTGTIPDFKTATLALQVAGEGTGPSLLELLRTSPINEKVGSYLVGFTLGGTGAISLDLQLPIKGEGETRVLGSVLLRDADLADAKWGLAFAKANGRVRFSNKGFAADDLAVLLGPDPAALSISSGEFTADPGHQVEGSLRGELPLAAVMSGFPALEPYWKLLPGRSDWTLELAIAQADADGHSRKRLKASSDLRGTAIDLPAPLRKDADSALPLRLEVGLPVAGERLRLELGRLLHADVQLPGPSQLPGAYLAFGLAEPAAPEAGRMVVRGDVAALDLGGWGALGGAGGADVGFLDADIEAGELIVLARAFRDVHVKLVTSEQESRLDASGAQIEGSVTVPGKGREQLGITAEFERLHLPDAPPGTKAAPVNPALVPPLHVHVKDLRFADARLGDARIESFPIADGMRVERLETSNNNLLIRAHGDWLLRKGVEFSYFDITFTAKSLGKMLDALGFAGMVEGGETVAHIKGTWPGSLAQFSLAKIDGTLDAKVGKGRILEVDPGAGRLFGLLSIQALPRRLALDFSDFFKTGLAFDTIQGTFELGSGNATTEDLAVKGPSVDIRVRGRTGLAGRDYDQVLEVTPKVGGVLPVIGAIAAGPAGAAAGLVVQNVLSSPIKGMVRARYKVTGSWDKPDIELIEKVRGPRRERAS